MNRKIFIIGIITFIIDQVTKVVISSLIDLEETVVVIKNFFSLTNINNTGAAFSILQNRAALLAILGVVCVLLLIKMMRETRASRLSNLSYGLLVGGVLGNLSDRIFLGSVRDFLKFNIFGYNFPVFNFADSCIVIGVVLLIILCIKDGGSNENNSKRLRKSN